MAEVLIGAKLWLLAPPGPAPPFDGNQTVLSWLLQYFPVLASDAAAAKAAAEAAGTGLPPLPSPRRTLQCTLREDEVLYVPPHWPHATLNLAPYTAFVSTFTLEHVAGEVQAREENTFSNSKEREDKWWEL